MTIEIREAREGDLGAVSDLWERLAKHHERLSDDFALAWDGRKTWEKYLRKRYSEMSTKLIVAEEGGELIGFMLCFLSPNVPVFKERKVGVVSDVFVSEERRNKGVCKEMMNVAVRWFRKNRVKSINLNVAAANIETRRIWHKLGFEPYLMTKRIDVDDYVKMNMPDENWVSRATKMVRIQKK